MTFATYGNRENPSLLLIPGLGVSYEIFLPLIDLLKDQYHIVAVGIDGFLIGQGAKFILSKCKEQDIGIATITKIKRDLHIVSYKDNNIWTWRYE